MWHKWPVLPGILLGGLLVWGCESSVIRIGDGHFDLAVTVVSESGPLRSVRCLAVANRDQAEDILRRPNPFFEGAWAADADPFDGRPLALQIPLTVRTSLTGRELSRAQLWHLAALGVMHDGRRVCGSVNIPDGRASRTVTVVLR